MNLLFLGYFVTILSCVSWTLIGESSFTKNVLSHVFDNVSMPPSGVLTTLNRKIFGSRRISIRRQPYVASIRRNVAHYLVGTIVTKNLVLTVAHPLINVSIAELAVVVGENYADRGAMLFTVILVIVHEGFNRSTLEHDIALLRIYEDIIYKGSVKSIFLMDDSKSLQGHQAFVSGWGRCDRTDKDLCLPRSTIYTRGEKFDPMLKTVSFYLNDNNSYCENYKFNGLYLGPGMMCQGIARGEDVVAPCLAVPGAPLVVDSCLTGILSWGFGCSYSSDLPLIYTSCQYYRSWINNNILILRGIRKVYLLKLFQVKRAYVLSEWLRLTRAAPEYTVRHDNRQMEPLRVDRELARLSGTVYDIRDFIYGGIHHKFKLKLYKELRKSFVTNIEREKYTADLQEMYEMRNKEIRPFLSQYNETSIQTDDESNDTDDEDVR